MDSSEGIGQVDAKGNGDGTLSLPEFGAFVQSLLDSAERSAASGRLYEQECSHKSLCQKKDEEKKKVRDDLQATHGVDNQVRDLFKAMDSDNNGDITGSHTIHI